MAKVIPQSSIEVIGGVLIKPPAQRVPDEKAVRDVVRAAVADHVRRCALVPPLTLEELRGHAQEVLASSGADPAYLDFTTVLVGNETWRETLAEIPYDRRVLLLPVLAPSRGVPGADG